MARKHTSSKTAKVAAIATPAEVAPAEVAEPANTTEPTRAPFRSAGFVAFRARHTPTWREKLQHHTHDNEDRVAELIASELAAQPEDKRSIWACPTIRELLPVAELQVRYADLNPGQVRMNLGNRLRNALRKAGR
jgi:hypothetical protein